MRLLIIGCEYAGKTTLARRISRWMIDSMGLPYVRWHDHFVVPRLDRHLIVHAGADAPVVGKDESDLNTAEDEDQILSLRPMVLEQLQRHNVWRHLHPDSFREEDSLFVNHFYAEAVYAPLYYGYGEPGSSGKRSTVPVTETSSIRRNQGTSTRSILEDTRSSGCPLVFLESWPRLPPSPRTSEPSRCCCPEPRMRSCSLT